LRCWYSLRRLPRLPLGEISVSGSSAVIVCPLRAILSKHRSTDATFVTAVREPRVERHTRFGRPPVCLEASGRTSAVLARTHLAVRTGPLCAAPHNTSPFRGTWVGVERRCACVLIVFGSVCREMVHGTAQEIDCQERCVSYRPMFHLFGTLPTIVLP
jgi:hypothetical protein